MTDAVDAAATFEESRPRLLRIAYGILGSIGEAEDVVQDAWLRLERADPATIENLPAWLTTVVGRLALDALGSARRRRETYVGEWLPEPLVAPAGADTTLDEKVTTALLVVLERLSPAERAAFLLHDVFDLPFEEVAATVGRSPAAVRQLASRARRHVTDGAPRFPASREESERVATAFAVAWQAGDTAALVALLDPGAVLRADGGGQVPSARKPLLGAERIARALVALGRGNARAGRETSGGFAAINGAPGLVLDDGQAVSVVSLTLDAGRIVAVDIVRNPDKLRHVEVPGS
jgi:RNA polymerase sigma-70 factor (ECF subfamily)